MKKLYHYTKASTLIENILPNLTLRSNYLEAMNDPREKELFAFGGVNVPYEKIYEGFYNEKTHIKCMYRLGDDIKQRIQVICFSGATGKGWDNEMMWAHYGDKHKGVCVELDEDRLLNNLSSTCKNFKIDDVDYSEKADRWLNWNKELDIEGNINLFINSKYKDLAFKKSSCWLNEDERRIMLINEVKPIFVSLSNAVIAIYLGTDFVSKYLPSITNQLPKNVKIYRLIYQHYRFEKWDV